ncbi:MAG: 23S rRNA (guanosine(2251)-2'-O)-methyltransferase RlmB [Coxiella sp. RIFCSPHIGHO2_12_FULL_42_15]|nr:MAG: 23S rRNA (guanosine(2251)-2'-O)-methyltransferase RlmB [Coxiella sp. RIFCSPHIGHO2_12_FULL_42_15]
MTEDLIYGLHAVAALLRAQPQLIKTLVVVESRSEQRVEPLLALAGRHRIPIRSVSRAEFNQQVDVSVVHQGIAAICHRFTGLDESVLHEIVKNSVAPKLILILDGVQDPHNLGACLRTANGFGVQAVVTTKDRACGLTPVVRKVACGAAEVTPFIQVTNLARTLTWLQEQGIWLVGMVGDTETRLQDIDFCMNTAIVMGNEAKGLRPLTRKHCDYLARIPMKGAVESFNVSAATAISLYEVMRQRDIDSVTLTANEMDSTILIRRHKMRQE